MLGHVVARYLADCGCDVATSDRRYDGTVRDELVDEVRQSEAPWVVNALGRTKHKSTNLDELLLANARLPCHLMARLGPQQRIIHASTDCVFSGKRGNYSSLDELDAEDAYGFSKALGEQVAKEGRFQVLRVSIIGPELKCANGLLAWFFREAGPIPGFTNHRWNGITTLEWSKKAFELISGSWEPLSPVVQLASPPVSKFELLVAAAATWSRRIEIVPTHFPVSIDRTLSGHVACPPINAQMEELKTWYESRFGPIPVNCGP